MKRRLLLSSSLLGLCAAGSAEAFWQSRDSNYDISVGYTGPGDFATAAAAIMLRGYSAATANAAQCVNLRRSSDNATSDFGLVNGNLDQTAIATWRGVNATGTGSISGPTLTFTGGVIGGQVTGGTVLPGTVILSGASPTWTVNLSQTVASATLAVANTLFVTQIYDQTGSTAGAVNATTTQQPYLLLSAQNGRPAVWYGDNGALVLIIASFPNIWATGGWAAFSGVKTTNPSASDQLFRQGSSAPRQRINTSSQFNFDQASSTSAGTWTTSGTLSNAAHTFDISYSQASLSNVPTITFDGAAQTLGTSTAPVGTITTATSIVLGGSGVNVGWPGFLMDMLFYATPSAGIQTAIRSNMKAYWGTI